MLAPDASDRPDCTDAPTSASKRCPSGRTQESFGAESPSKRSPFRFASELHINSTAGSVSAASSIRNFPCSRRSTTTAPGSDIRNSTVAGSS